MVAAGSNPSQRNSAFFFAQLVAPPEDDAAAPFCATTARPKPPALALDDLAVAKGAGIPFAWIFAALYPFLKRKIVLTWDCYDLKTCLRAHP